MLKRINHKRALTLSTAMAAVLGGTFYLSTGTSQAGESCPGLDNALRNNLNFIANEQRHPNPLSEDKINNRQLVIDDIQDRREDAGCTAKIKADKEKHESKSTAPESDKEPDTKPDPDDKSKDNRKDDTDGNDACAGSNVTFFNEYGPAAASSGQFPIGTRLRVTNLENDESIVVTVTSTSGSCVLLNNAAFEEIRRPGKNVIRDVVVEPLD